MPKPGPKKRIKLTQKQMGDISPKVRQEVKERSGDICEVKNKCRGDLAVHQAHITNRTQINHKTTADDLLHVCLACHKWLDESEEGIRHRRQLREDTA